MNDIDETKLNETRITASKRIFAALTLAMLGAPLFIGSATAIAATSDARELSVHLDEDGAPSSQRSEGGWQRAVGSSGLGVRMSTDPEDEDAGDEGASPEDGGGDSPDSGVIDLGEDEASQRSCPGLSVTPEAFFGDYELALNKVGNDRIPYFSCGPDCQALTGDQKQRNIRLWSLVSKEHAGSLFYGKASPRGFHALADALVSNGAEAEWSTLAGLDCNGFAHRFAEANGWSWAGVNLDPPKYASKPHVQTTRDICPGDFIVYENVRHVAVVGERTGQEVVNGITLDTFKVYESVSDGTPKGLQVNIQGFDLRGKDHFTLHHHNQSTRASRTNAVVVVPGPGTL